MELINVKNQILGKWKIFDKNLNKTAHYTFDVNFQYITETGDKTAYSISERNGDIFYTSQESVEIVGISKKIMVWKKGDSYHLFVKVS